MTYAITYENDGKNNTRIVTGKSLEDAIRNLGFNPKPFIWARLVTYTESVQTPVTERK